MEKILDLPKENFRVRKVTAPWEARTEKIKVRVASKDLVKIIKNIKKIHSI